MLTVKFDFEELKLPTFGEGALFYGQALLKDNGDGDFYVAEVFLKKDSGKYYRLAKTAAAANDPVEPVLFKSIEKVLYDTKTTDGRLAALEWSDAVSELLASRLTGHNSAARLERAYGASLS